MGGAVCGINIRGEEEVSPAPVKTAEEGFRMLTPPLFSEDQQRQTLSPDISTATPSLCEEGVNPQSITTRVGGASAANDGTR